jgi:hypothetical protein
MRHLKQFRPVDDAGIGARAGGGAEVETRKHRIEPRLMGRRQVGLLLLLSGALLPVGSLLAQGQGGLGQTSVREVESSFDNASQLTGPKKLENSEQYLSQMKDIIKRGFEALGEARGEKDLVKMNCINEKLTSQKGLLKISEQAYIQLQDAVVRSDMPAANHEYTKIAVAFQKMRGLGVETEGCAGEALRYTGDTKVEVEVDKSITSDDPTVRYEEEPILDEHPESTSPVE